LGLEVEFGSRTYALHSQGPGSILSAKTEQKPSTSPPLTKTHLQRYMKYIFIKENSENTHKQKY
jgi:hypothetical protein